MKEKLIKDLQSKAHLTINPYTNEPIEMVCISHALDAINALSEELERYKKH